MRLSDAGNEWAEDQPPAEFQADWLALREPFDALARSEMLAQVLIATLPARPRLLDLGAGTGSLLRWLAPRIGRAQSWTLVDFDRALIAEAFDTIADRAEVAGLNVTAPNRRTLLVHAPGGAWRVEALVADLAAVPRHLPLQQTDAVLCSALADLVSVAWIERLAAALRVPFYAALCVDGRDRFWPPHPRDGVIAGAFRRDQRRDKGFGGPALGPAAPAAIARLFAARGFAVRSAVSNWVVQARGGQAARELLLPPEIVRGFLSELVRGHADAARRWLRGRGVDEWALARLNSIADGALTCRIGHSDVLALPQSSRQGPIEGGAMGRGR
jgi:SAM-dependent methyltransferase